MIKSIAGFAVWASAVAGLGLAPSGEPHALSKKGGEQCSADSECETSVCRDGTCDPCPDPDKNCPPPGTCDADRLKSLNERVDEWCKGPERSCGKWGFDDSDADCAELKSRLKAGVECAEARELRERECFKGGDLDHRQALAVARKVADECSKKIEFKLSRDICCECEGYQRRLKDVGSVWKSPTECEEQKNQKKVDCQGMRAKIENAVAIRKALDALAPCFNGQLSEPRKKRFSTANEHESHCRDVLDFKEGKKLCQ